MVAYDRFVCGSGRHAPDAHIIRCALSWQTEKSPKPSRCFTNITDRVQAQGLATENRAVFSTSCHSGGRFCPWYAFRTTDGGLELPASATYVGAFGQVADLAMPGGLSTAKTYDNLGRLDTVTNSIPGQAPASTVSSFDYTYDSHDRRTRADLADAGHWDYTYDAAGQLTGGTRTAPGLDGQPDTVVQYGYQYDPMGNPTQRTEDAGVTTYTFNNLSRA